MNRVAPVACGWDGEQRQPQSAHRRVARRAAGTVLRVLYTAQRTHTLASTGPYAHIRHPQYVAFFLLLLGFFIQWPTLLTLLMLPALVVMYLRLARREERDALATFGAAYAEYAARTPAFLPQHRRTPAPSGR